MNPVRLVLCVVAPPLAVLDKGCGSLILVSVLTLLGWIPGIIGALAITFFYHPQPRFVSVPDQGSDAAGEPDYDYGPAKRKREFIRLADGEIAELIEDDGQLPEENDNHGYQDQH